MKKGVFILMLLPLFLNAQIITTIAGNGTVGYKGDGGNAVSAEFNRPVSTRFDRVGNIYVADWVNNVIRKIDMDGIITTVAGNGYGAGLPGVGGYAGDGGPATAAELFGPSDVAFDIAGNMFIADNDNALIRKVTTSGIISRFAGIGTFGYNGDGIPATSAQLNYPCGLVFDKAGNLYFSDAGNRRVRKIDHSGIIITVAGNGISGNSGDNGPATAAQFQVPCMLAISPSGDLYIPDWRSNSIRKVNSLGIITTVAGNGAASDTGDGGPAIAASIYGCQAVAFDSMGNYYISSLPSCYIRKVNTSGIISTVVGTGTCGFYGEGGSATAAQIQTDVVCSLHVFGNLFIADEKNGRIRKVTYNHTAINEIKQPLQNIIIQPNPAHNTITTTTLDKIESIALINLIGQEVFKQFYSKAEKSEIDISSFANGIYFVKVNGVYAGKFLKE